MNEVNYEHAKDHPHKAAFFKYRSLQFLGFGVNSFVDTRTIVSANQSI